MNLRRRGCSGQPGPGGVRPDAPTSGSAMVTGCVPAELVFVDGMTVGGEDAQKVSQQAMAHRVKLAEEG